VDDASEAPESAKRLDCVRLAGALAVVDAIKSGSKLSLDFMWTRIGPMNWLGYGSARQRLGLRQSSAALDWSLRKRQRTGAVQNLAASDRSGS